MKIQLSSCLIIAALCGAFTSPGQPAPGNDYSRDTLSGDRFHLGKLEKAGKLIGLRVTDPAEQKLGKVKDLAVDLKNGRIVEVIVATGSVFSAQERFAAVPPDQFTCDAAKNVLALNFDRQRFSQSPSFKITEWDQDVSQDNITGVYQYYGSRAYFLPPGPNSPAKDPEAQVAVPLGKVQRASEVIGATVENPRHEKLGKVENLIVDLNAGRVVEVVLASGGFLGMNDELSVVPPQAFQPAAEHDRLVLDASKETLARAPHFKSREWPDLNNPDPAFYGASYRAFNVDPYFITDAADSTALPVRHRQDTTGLTPPDQGNSPSDLDTTRQIQQQIMGLNGLSTDGQKVKIITVDGRVTLNGQVDSETEKQEITGIARKIAPDAKVDDQLQIKDTSGNSMK